MKTLWTSEAAMDATGGSCSAEWQAFGVSIDTRTLEKDDLFVALQDVRDGHEFVAQALEKGAAAALVSRVPDGVDADRMLVVPDVLAALRDLASAARDRSAAKLVAITGSVGKTGSKEMLKVALAGSGKIHAAEKSYNNHWGVPLTLARMPQDSDFAIIEIGMNHPGEIEPLSRLSRPDVALVTNVAAVHIEAFDSVEGIAREKASVFCGLSENGVAVVHADCEFIAVLEGFAADAKARIIRFGSAETADFRLASYALGSNSTEVSASIYAKKKSFVLGGSGRHLALNSLAVLAVVDALGLDVDKAAQNLERWHPPSGRGERWQVGGIVLVDESYNANPTSMAAALDVLADTGSGRKIAILGDMLELGEGELELHRELATLQAMQRIDLVHCVGERMKALHDALPDGKRGEWAATSAQMVAMLPQLLGADDVVMVKGSLGSKTGLLVDAIKNMGDASLLMNNGDNA